MPLKISYKLRKGNSCKELKASIIDISGGGMCFDTDYLLRPNDKIEADIYDKKLTPKHFLALCRVVWSKELKEGRFVAGVQYLKVEDKDIFDSFICDSLIDVSLKDPH